MADDLAVRMAASELADAQALLARHARALAEDAVRIADRAALPDANPALLAGGASRLLHDAGQLVQLAARFHGMKEFAAFLPKPPTSGEDAPT